jgi:hypothetical protein
LFNFDQRNFLSAGKIDLETDDQTFFSFQSLAENLQESPPLKGSNEEFMNKINNLVSASRKSRVGELAAVHRSGHSPWRVGLLLMNKGRWERSWTRLWQKPGRWLGYNVGVTVESGDPSDK